MNPARLIVLFVALLAGGAAAYMFYQPPAREAPRVEAPKIETVNVLVAKSDIPIGTLITPDLLAWMAWPVSAPTSMFLTQTTRAGAMEDLKGSVARFPFVAGEPIREAKLIKGNGSGFMAAILPSGKRAMSFEISPETSAGGFILPNDYVDVLLTQRETKVEGRSRDSGLRSQILLADIRVLAIDQTIEERDGLKVVIGKTATLELSPEETTRLAAARQSGTLSLVLRSLVDANKPRGGETKGERTEVNIIRFGVSSSNTVE